LILLDKGFRCPAYALLSYGVASRCQVSEKRNIGAETLGLGLALGGFAKYPGL